MPPLEESNLNGYAVLWEATEFNDEFGNPVVSQPREIACRWQDGLSQIEGIEQQITLTKATVFVLEEIPINSILRKGRLEDLPDTINNLKKVVFVDYEDDLKGRVTSRFVMVSDYNNSQLPTLTGTGT